MTSPITVRPERSDDASEIARLVISAYAAVPYSDHREHLMIARLRDSDAYVPGLALLAEAGTQAVGHIMLTEARIGEGSGAAMTLALAPLSVSPEHQRRGVGKLLVRTAHARAAELGYESILLIGIPDYYRQFGYQSLDSYPIFLPFDAPVENCMIFPLKPNALDRLAGRVHYGAAWLNH